MLRIIVRLERIRKIYGTDGKFATDVVDNGGATWLDNISANFRKKSQRLYFYFQSLWEDDLWKKPEAKNLVTLSLSL